MPFAEVTSSDGLAKCDKGTNWRRSVAHTLSAASGPPMLYSKNRIVLFDKEQKRQDAPLRHMQPRADLQTDYFSKRK